jgi:hypothetical protein
MKSVILLTRRGFRARNLQVLGMAFAVAFASALGSQAALADDLWNNSSGGSWATNGNWSLGAPPPNNGIPGVSDNAVFNLGSVGGYTVTASGVQTPQRLNIETDNVILGSGNIDNVTQFLVGASAGQIATLNLLPGTAVGNWDGGATTGVDQIGSTGASDM